MRALLAKLKGPWHFVQYIEEFGKNHVRKNMGQLYSKNKQKNKSVCIHEINHNENEDENEK